MAAKRKQKKSGKNKNEPKGLWKRIKKFFSDIKAELKRVTWPDKKRLKSNTGIVIAIILLSVVMIFAFDTIISTVFNLTGFYDYDNKPEIAVTETEEAQDSDAEIVEESTTESIATEESE